jgi:hypothetical protein
VSVRPLRFGTIKEDRAMARRALLWIALLAAITHAVGIARTSLPAQDGLKFLRVARDFQTRSPLQVIRGTDQHPLYPALIALAEPPTRAVLGPGPDTWRIAAQGVSAIATIAVLWPLCAFATAVFGPSTGALAALLWALLPVPAEVGRDTLSDPVYVLFFAIAMACGERAIRTGRLTSYLGCGLAVGMGYWARPEAAIVGAVVLGAASIDRLRGLTSWRDAILNPVSTSLLARPLPALALAFLVPVGAYAAVKGEVSEKLALRSAVGLPSNHQRSQQEIAQTADDPFRGFEPKEEDGRDGPMTGARALRWALHAWAEGLGGALAVVTLVAGWRLRSRSRAGRLLAGGYALAFGIVWVRHASTFGYVSGRHALTLVILSLPWAAAGLIAASGVVATWFRLRPDRSVMRRRVAIGALVLMGLCSQMRPAHASRAAHREAGLWLANHCPAEGTILDTRGWAAFFSGRDSYGPWHARQAAADPRLAFVVVGDDEMTAPSCRGMVLRNWLQTRAEPAATFGPADGKGSSRSRVSVFRIVTMTALAPGARRR